MTQQQEDQPALFKLGDECSFSKCDIVKILPFPEVTGKTKTRKKHVLSSDSKIR